MQEALAYSRRNGLTRDLQNKDSVVACCLDNIEAHSLYCANSIQFLEGVNNKVLQTTSLQSILTYQESYTTTLSTTNYIATISVQKPPNRSNLPWAKLTALV